MFHKAESSNSQDQDSSSESRETKPETRSLEGFYEELPIVKEIAVVNSVTVSVRKCPETAKNLLYLETDLPDHVVVHWGICKDNAKRWEIPAAPHPPETVVFKDKALRTRLQVCITLSSLLFPLLSCLIHIFWLAGLGHYFSYYKNCLYFFCMLLS